jgi:membrane fusion protein (multidrug efflux system)
MIIVAGILLVVIASIAFVKYRQIQVAIAQGSSYVPPPEAVTTVVAEEANWQGSLRAIGTVVPVEGVLLSADLPGVVDEILFESGHTARAGDVLVRLDTKQERAQLASAAARRDVANLNLERASDLLAKGAISQSDYDQVDAESRSTSALAEEIEAIIQRKTIRAPFSGVLGIRQVNLGQYLAGGDPVVPLQKRAPIFVNFSVPQQEASVLKTGTEVIATTTGGGGSSATGKITAINSVIDPSTRNIEAQATFANTDGGLRAGMFVEVEVRLDASSRVIALPASAVNYAPYGNSVYVVEDVAGPGGDTYRGVRQQFVKLGGGRGDQVAVLSGVKPGEEIVTSGVFKLRPGAAVSVNNDVQPANSAEPSPEDS